MNFKSFNQYKQEEILSNTLSFYKKYQYKNIGVSLDEEGFKSRLFSSNLGLLKNVPFGFKDNIAVEGFNITLSSKLFHDNYINYDAKVVENLKSEGAVPFTNLSMHELAYGTTGDRSVSGPTSNYKNDELMAGGSSSGSAVAVGLGIVPMALGSDTSGSIRIPAAYADVVGFKPAYNDLSLEGVYPLSKSLDHVGPIANNVENAYISYRIMQGTKPNDLVVNEDELIKNISILVPEVEKLLSFEEGLLENFFKVVDILKEKGFKIKKASLPYLEEILNYQKTILRYESYDLYKDELHNLDNFDEEVHERILAGKKVKDKDYHQALDKRKFLLEIYDDMVGDNILLLPTMLIYPKKLQERKVTLEGYDHIRECMFNLTAPFNYLAMPALSFPTNFKNEHYHSTQVIAKQGNEDTLFKVAKVIENKFLE